LKDTFGLLHNVFKGNVLVKTKELYFNDSPGLSQPGTTEELEEEVSGVVPKRSALDGNIKLLRVEDVEEPGTRSGVGLEDLFLNNSFGLTDVGGVAA
jgi:DNA/RNA endonuclease YhcR with UshA esterase domain